MRFYEFGNTEKPGILLFPGTCCHWKNNFGHVIEPLQKYFYVICVSYDGFDENEDRIFPDMLTETEKIEQYVNEKYEGRICAVYGCSLGGSFVGLLMQRKNIRIDHGFIGSSDLDQSDGWKAALSARIATPFLYRIMVKEKVPNWMINRIKKKASPEYADAFLNNFLGGSGVKLDFVKKQSVYNQYYSDLKTPLNDRIRPESGTIHCLYAKKMGPVYLERYRKHFDNPDIIEHDLRHEELLLCFPEQWVMTLAGACGLIQ